MKKKTAVALIVLGVVTAFLTGASIFAVTTLNSFHEAGVEVAHLDGSNSEVHVDEQGTSGSDGENDNTAKKSESVDPYLEMINKSSRINVLCLGIAEYQLADTMIVASFDPDERSLDLISVPRDTYFYRAGFDKATEKKINASYYGKTSAERAQSAMNSARDVLQIPIHHFVKIEYRGVEKIIDSIGGVEVNVPFDMNYDDPTGDLHIHFVEGKKLMNGSDAVKYLRFRQNNDGTHSGGDIERIKRQQKLIMTAIEKSLNLKLLKIVDIAKDYVKTSMTADDMVSYAGKLSKINIKSVKTHILPGEAKLIDKTSYYVQDKKATKTMITEIYGGDSNENN